MAVCVSNLLFYAQSTIMVIAGQVCVQLKGEGRCNRKKRVMGMGGRWED